MYTSKNSEIAIVEWKVIKIVFLHFSSIAQWEEEKKKGGGGGLKRNSFFFANARDQYTLKISPHV